MEKSYIIPIHPIGWKRAGVNSKYGKPIFYDRQAKEKICYGLYLLQQHGADPLFEGPLELNVVYYFKIPHKLTKQKKPCLYQCATPDIDNLNGLLFDSCNKVIFKDDCLISKQTTVKLYDKNPRIEITVRNLV
jgi:Holliday junction resolvase RusA-like endonuclease